MEPDMVISHSGWGCGLHVREVWPSCHHIAYMEWWFDPESDFFRYDPNNRPKTRGQQATKLWLRNQSFALELSALMRWWLQRNGKKQLPPVYAKIATSFTTELISNDSSQTLNNSRQHRSQSDLWNSRHGTHAGVSSIHFKAFTKSCSSATPRWVEIAGEDEANYGGKKFDKKTSAGANGQRVSFPNGPERQGQLAGISNLDDYVKWLQRSLVPRVLEPSIRRQLESFWRHCCDCPMVVERCGTGARALRRDALISDLRGSPRPISIANRHSRQSF